MLFLTSLTRNTDFAERPFEVVNLPREQWATGDFVAAGLSETSELAATFAIETSDGRRVEVIPGVVIVGALRRRAATLELVGDWTCVGKDLRMHPHPVGSTATSPAVELRDPAELRGPTYSVRRQSARQ